MTLPENSTIGSFPGPDGDSTALTDATQGRLRTALLDTYFKNSRPQPSESELDDHVRGRFDICRSWFIPWLQRHIDLEEMNIFEIGCGTGSTTAALALATKSVAAYDIASKSVSAAALRIEIMEIKNAKLHALPFDRILEDINGSKEIDCAVLFAVLEHQKYAERLATLRACWNALKPGGFLIVADTPSRLTWTDYHTSLLPFFNGLPDEIAIDYADRSPRQSFRDAIASSSKKSEAEALELLSCLGRGVSYHEFEIALGNVDSFVVGDGFDPEPLSYFGVSLETRLLYTYARRKHLRVSPAFLRDTIEVILRKPGPFPAKAARRSLSETEAIIRPLAV